MSAHQVALTYYSTNHIVHSLPDPPELSVDTQPQDITRGQSFTFNCTPMSSNPMADIVFKLNNSNIVDSSVTISGYVLTISSIQRSHQGTYSCVVSNKISSSSAEIAVNVFGEWLRINTVTIVLCGLDVTFKILLMSLLFLPSSAPPTPPRSLSFSNPQPFSSTVSWSPPEDNGGDPNPLTYRINVINDTVTMMYNTSGLELQLTNLWHSRSYNVSVVAVNMYGTSPPAEMVLTTPDSGN